VGDLDLIRVADRPEAELIRDLLTHMGGIEQDYFDVQLPLGTFGSNLHPGDIDDAMPIDHHEPPKSMVCE
jgi:hypothetical protein